MTLLKLSLILLLLHFHATRAQEFRVASLNLSVPYLMTGEDGNYEGFIIDMLDEMDIGYKIVSPEDRRYGALNENSGKWSGMMGMIIDNKADLIAADLTMTAHRSKYVDFTPPFLNSELTVLVKITDNNNSNMLDMVFQPFSALLWIMVLLLYILTSCVFWMVSRINPEERGLTIFDAFWNIASAFVYASRPAPNACSKRLVLLGWWIFGIVMLVVYAVSLKPFLNGGQSVMALETVDDLLAVDHFRFTCYKGGSTHALLKDSPDELHQAIFDRLDLFDGKGTKEMLEDLYEAPAGTFGIITESGTADHILGTQCDYALRKVGNLAARYYGLALPKGSPNKATLSEKVLELNDKGILQSLKTKWWPSCPSKATEKEAENQIDLGPAGGIFLLLGIFLVLGILAAILELVQATKQDKELNLVEELKKALFPCLPKKKEKVEDQEEKLEEIPISEKQNGEELA